MPNWEFLNDEGALAAVVPDEYAGYRRPIGGALAAFLSGLSLGRQSELLAEQAALPWSATLPQRLVVFAPRGCPVLHKLGQVVARDRRVSPELRWHLQELESLPPAVPLEVIHEVLTRELGPLDRLGVSLEPALAEASVAVVVPFRCDGPRARPERRHRGGVFKILKPGIVERLDEELGLLQRVGSYLDERCHDFQIPPLDYAEAFEQVREKLSQEVRLDREQDHLARAREFYAGEPRVLIPEPWVELCTPRVTAMERVSGHKVTDHALETADERRRLASLVAAALIARPAFAKDPEALFHGDPHAGNLFLTSDGRLAVLDWSLVGVLSARDRAAIVQVLLGAVTLDAEHVVATLASLAEAGRYNPAALGAVVQERLRRVRSGEFPGFAWLTSLLDDAVGTAGLRVGSELMLFRKTLHTLEGVVADVGGGDREVQMELQKEFLRRLAGEWPFRWLAPPQSRAFASQLSNADLAQLMFSLPWTVTRFWLDRSFDLLDRLRGRHS